MELLTQPYYQQETNGSPRWIITMDRVCVKQHAAPHQTTGHRPGAVELWHRLYPLVGPWHSRDLLGFAAQAATRQSRTAFVRMVSGCQRQGWKEAYQPGGYAVLCAAAGLDCAPVD